MVDSLPQMPDPRERLLRRVVSEATAFANADHTVDQLRLGRLYGLLEAGVLAGFWSANATTERGLLRFPLGPCRV